VVDGCYLLLFFAGSFLRFVDAIFFSSLSLIDLAMLFEAPFSEDFDLSPRFAASAAPAAICCFLDFAGIQAIRPLAEVRLSTGTLQRRLNPSPGVRPYFSS